MKKVLAATILSSTLALLPFVASADTSASIQALLAQIKALQTQLNTLKAQQAQVASTTASVSANIQLIRGMKEGMSGDDVAALQALLASDPTLTSGLLIDGKFGSTTREALKKFQRKHGFEAVGYVGPKTLRRLNELMRELGMKQRKGSNDDKEFCIKVPPGHLIAPGLFKMDEGRKEGRNKFRVVDCDKVKPTPTPTVTPTPTPTATPTPIATTTPTITNQASASVTVGSTIFDRATLSNGNAPTGTMSFNVYGPWDSSCSAAISPAPGSVAVNGNATYNSGNITATTTGTYKFIAYYSGDSKNYAVSTNCSSAGNSVVVTALPDTTAPVISAVGTSNLLGTTTNVVWNTNENSNSKIWFGTTTPVVTTGSANISDSNYVSSHLFSLSGLATSTTYYYVVTSADAAGNTATSSQSSFLTTVGL